MASVPAWEYCETSARAISYILGSLFAYYANSFVTFSGNRSTTEKLRAFIVYTACLIMAVLVNKLARIPLADFEHTVFLSWVISQANGHHPQLHPAEQVGVHQRKHLTVSVFRSAKPPPSKR